MIKQKGFTLAELLVVIAIIGLLSSIVLVAAKGATERAKIAAVLQFSAQVYHALGAYAVGIWDFDEGSGNIANDRSGNNNNGTINVGVGDDVNNKWKCASVSSENTPSGQGCSLYFDGSDDYVDLGAGTFDSLTEATIELWFKPNNYGSGNNHFITFMASEWQKRLGLYFNANEKKFLWMSPSSGFGDIVGNTPVTLNWQHLAVTISSEGTKLYVNGNLDGNNSGKVSFANITPTVVNVIGTLNTGSGFTNGLIDQVRIYEQALTQAQIQKLYAEGAKKHGLLVKE